MVYFSKHDSKAHHVCGGMKLFPTIQLTSNGNSTHQILTELRIYNGETTFPARMADKPGIVMENT